jgi:hypothetical protein
LLRGLGGPLNLSGRGGEEEIPCHCRAWNYGRPDHILATTYTDLDIPQHYCYITLFGITVVIIIIIIIICHYNFIG